MTFRKGDRSSRVELGGAGRGASYILPCGTTRAGRPVITKIFIVHPYAVNAGKRDCHSCVSIAWYRIQPNCVYVLLYIPYVPLFPLRRHCLPSLPRAPGRAFFPLGAAPASGIKPCLRAYFGQTSCVKQLDATADLFKDIVCVAYTELTIKGITISLFSGSPFVLPAIQPELQVGK